MRLVLETPAHAEAIARLHETALGPGRFARAAERLRENNRPIEALCFVALADDGVLRASVRCWPIQIGEAAPSVLLGPLAVAAAVRDQGYGLALLRRVADAASQAGEARILLVGDLPYYERAGFARTAPGAIEMPGPTDPSRVLGLALTPGAFEGVQGRVCRAR